MSNANSTPGRTKSVDRLKSLKGQAKPFQPTLIRESTARSLRYLESRGLADMSGTNLFVVPSKYPKKIHQSNGDTMIVMKSVTDGESQGAV